MTAGPPERFEPQRGETLAELVRALEADSGLGPAREERLVQRVLARTTREDPGWRGDLALWSGFLRSRLGASRALRLVAASLAAHLAALPVFAWLAHREAPTAPGFRTGIDWAEVDALAEPDEPERPIELPARYVSLDLDEALRAPRDRAENAVRRDRFLLQRADLTGAGATRSDGGSLKIRLLAARTRQLAGSAGTRAAVSEREIDALAADVRDHGGTLERGLLAELLLDRFVLGGSLHGLTSPRLASGRAPDGLRGALRRLAADASDAPATSAVGRAALDRARAYGLWEAGLDFDPLDQPGPLDAERLALLAEAWPADGEPLPAPWDPRRR